MAAAKYSSSMTGYGKAVVRRGALGIEAEIKTLNNRHLDFIFKLPREYVQYEGKIRELLSGYFKRGRIDVYVSRLPSAGTRGKLTFNQPLFDKINRIFSAQAKRLKILDREFHQRSLIEILSRKDVLEVSQDEAATVAGEEPALMAALKRSSELAARARRAEGQKLVKDISNRAAKLRHCLTKIKKLAPESQKKAKQALLSKVNALGVKEIDQQRLEQEVALLVLRSDITEELVRLESHLHTLSVQASYIDGKRLEFLLQEILREYNTIGSKSSDVGITNCVLEAKAEIERIREQSQNLE